MDEATIRGILSQYGTMDEAMIRGIISRMNGMTVPVRNDGGQNFGRVRQLGQQSQALREKYQQTGNPETLNESIRIAELALEADPTNNALLQNLGASITTRYEETCEEKHFEEVLSIARRSRMDLGAMLSNLCLRLQNSFRSTGNTIYLEHAICRGEDGARATPNEHPDRGGRLTNLSNALAEQFMLSGLEKDANKAVTVGKEALQAAGSQKLRAICLNNLGRVFHSRFDCWGEEKDLDEAISLTKEGIRVTESISGIPGARLSNLSSLLALRFEATGDPDVLEDSIQAAEKGLSGLSPGDPAMLTCLSVLGNRLEKRSEWKENTEDLEEAIRLTEKALELAPDGNTSRATVLSQLSTKLQSRARWTGNPGDLERAVLNLRQAVDITPTNHPHRPSWLMNLSNMIGSWYEGKGETERADLNDAIDYAKQALASSPDDHPRFPDVLSNLAAKLATRFRNYAEDEDFPESLSAAECSVLLTSENDPKMASRQLNLGSLLNSSTEDAHKDRALESYLSSWRCSNGIPLVRISSARLAISILIERNAWARALDLAKEAIDLMPSVSRGSLRLSDQQYTVSRFAGLAADACALSLHVNDDKDGALELLEQGRGVILGMLINRRNDISELEQSYPEEAAAYERLRLEVSNPIADEADPVAKRTQAKRRQEAHRQLEITIQNIRGLPGHSRFLLATTSEELKKHAAGGTIVVINITDFRSDAILVSSDAALQHIKLPGLTYAKCREWIRKDLTRGNLTLEERANNNKEYRDFLLWLWKACVKLVINKLQANVQVSTANLPRIWWIGVGLASFLPFHAAGRHAGNSTETTLHCAISSYTPTIKALAYSRERATTAPASLPPRELSLLAVTMPTTPGQSDLSQISVEIKAIEAVTKDRFSLHEEKQPDAATALDHVKDCVLAHFACHGVVDLKVPSNSYLVLQKVRAVEGNTEIVQDPLTVQKISELALRRARVAYLSACSTAQNRSGMLADEVIHLASGFQVAGFPHVIGCLWPAYDEVCADLAGAFYGEVGKLDLAAACPEQGVAQALHTSLLAVRSKIVRQPLAWAPYVHFGA